MSNHEQSLSKEVKSNPKLFFAHAKSEFKYPSSVQNLKDGSKVITSGEGKATIFNCLFLIVFTKDKNALPDFEPVCEAISGIILKTNLKRNCLI